MHKHVVKTTVAIVLALAAFAALLAGCAGSAGGGTLSSEILVESSAFKVTADNADANAAISVGGAVTLKEGDVLLVSPDMTKGELQVTLADKSGTVYDSEVSGRVLETHEVPAGTYDIAVGCKEAGTTGAIVVAAVNADEFEQQDRDLDQALESLGVK